MAKTFPAPAFICAALVLLGWNVLGQDQKPPASKNEPKPAETAPAKTAHKPDLRATMTQLENVSRALYTAEQAAIQNDPALQAERQALLDELHEVVEKMRAFEQKVEDKVLASSPDSKQLVEEKRQLVAKLEGQGPAKRAGILSLNRLLKSLFGEGPPGRKGEKVGKREK